MSLTHGTPRAASSSSNRAVIHSRRCSPSRQPSCSNGTPTWSVSRYNAGLRSVVTSGCGSAEVPLAPDGRGPRVVVAHEQRPAAPRGPVLGLGLAAGDVDEVTDGPHQVVERRGSAAGERGGGGELVLGVPPALLGDPLGAVVVRERAAAASWCRSTRRRPRPPARTARPWWRARGGPSARACRPARRCRTPARPSGPGRPRRAWRPAGSPARRRSPRWRTRRRPRPALGSPSAMARRPSTDRTTPMCRSQTASSWKSIGWSSTSPMIATPASARVLVGEPAHPVGERDGLDRGAEHRDRGASRRVPPRPGSGGGDRHAAGRTSPAQGRARTCHHRPAHTPTWSYH